MKKKILPILLASNIFLTGCSGTIPNTEVIKPNIDKTEISSENVAIESSTTSSNTVTEEKKDDIAKDTENINSDIEIINSDGVFDINTACNLVDHLYKDTNIMVSPLSIYMALGMAANGADNNTLLEFENFFGCSLEELNELSRKVINADSQILSIANGIWVKDNPSIKLKENYIETIKEFYNGEIQLSNMDLTTVNEINDFIKTNTNNMIPGLINELPDSIVSVLVNALYFEALWIQPYEEWQVEEGKFDKKFDVKYLIETGNSYMENDKAIGFKKYYKDGYSFIAILPKDNGEFNLYDLDINSLIESECFNYDVNTMIPKFEFEWDSNLNEVLNKMGVIEAFDATNADFSNMFESSDDIYISDVIHKTKIELSESGTKAAAVTVIMMDGNSMIMELPETRDVFLDRPFAFIIMDEENEIPLFIGKVIEF